MSFKEILDRKEEEKEEEKEKKKEKEKEKNKEKEKEKDETDEKIRTLFKKIRTFDQLKNEVYEIKKSYEKTCEEINEFKEKTDITLNKFGKNRGGRTTFEQIEEEKNYKNLINDKLTEIDKKFKIILGDININEEEKEKEKEKKIAKNNKDNSKDTKDNKNSTTNKFPDQEKKGKILNLSEINRRLGQLHLSKISTYDFDAKNEITTKKLAEVESRMNELITNLFGENRNNLKIKNKLTFVSKKEFDDHKSKSEEEFSKILGKIDKLKKLFDDIINKEKDKTSITDLENMRDLILKKIEELFLNQNEKYSSNFSNLEVLQEQFKKLLELLAIKEEEKENWLIAKKPINGYSCASCESFIGDLKNDKNKFIHWNKMPTRERDLTGEKFYRIGNGYSRLLQMINFDSNGNVTLNPFPNSNNNSSTNNNSINMSGNDNFNKSGELNKSSSYERIHSAKNKKGSKEKNKYNDLVVKSRNEEIKTNRKLPAIKSSMSSDNFDKLIDKKNINIINQNISIGGNNTSYNFQNSKITKVLKKNQLK